MTASKELKRWEHYKILIWIALVSNLQFRIIVPIWIITLPNVCKKLINRYSCMSLYMRWPSTNFYTFSFFFREIVMRTRHPGGNGNFSPGKILAWGEITISPRVTSAHDDFTEKNRFCTYINSNRNRFSEWPLMSGIEISSSRGL